MELNFEDQEHVTSVLAGFESLYFKTPDQNNNLGYLSTCLTLNGVNMSSVAGTESFTDAIKEVGRKFYEAIRNLLQSIWNYFFGPKGNKIAQEIKQTATAVEVVAKRELPNELQKAEPEVQAKVEEIAERVIENVSINFHVTHLSDKYLNDKDGVYTDAQKAAKLVGIVIPDFVNEIANIQKTYDHIKQAIENHTVAKTGSIQGTLKNIEQAAWLCVQYADLRNQYNKINAGLIDATKKANELTKGYDKSGKKDDDQERVYRQARKVTLFLAGFNNAVASAQAGCDKNVKRIAQAFGSMLIQLDYESRTVDSLIKSNEDLDKFMNS